MAGILAERGIEPTATEATVLALGIHEDTGSLTYASTTVRDVEALAFCLRHGANQELIGGFLHTPLDAAIARSDHPDRRVRAGRAGGVAVLVAARWSRYVDGVSTLPKVTDLNDSPAMVMLVEMDGRVFAVGRSRTAAFDVAAAMAPWAAAAAQAASARARRDARGARARLGAALALASRPAASGRRRVAPPWFVDADSTIGGPRERGARHPACRLPPAARWWRVAREDMGRAIGTAPTRRCAGS
jgi:tRNA nucleotidyltransferase (CCA-adding enzyme)